MFVFDRVTGEPIWPIEERAVEASTAPGEKTAPTQAVPHEAGTVLSHRDRGTKT